MNLQIQDIIKTFESKSKNKHQKYNDFLGHVYITFHKKILLCKTDREMNKYKKMRNSVLSYIVANERAIKSEICK
jgi:hypothetical protein